MSWRMIKRGPNVEFDGCRGLKELSDDARLMYYMADETLEGRNALIEPGDRDFDLLPKLP